MAEDSGGVRFEKQDVTPGAIVRFGIVLAVVSIAISIVLVYMLRSFAGEEAAQEPPPPPMARYEAGRLPPEPRLQVNPFVDIETLQAEEERTLATYGWVDEKAGTVRIPIDRAMEILAEQGLPHAESPAEAKP